MLLGLFISAIISCIIGGIVAGVTGIGFLFWVVSIIIFVVSLPFTLINGFIQDKIDYVQDRKDNRMLMHEIAEDERVLMHEIAEDERLEKYIESFEDIKDIPTIYIDNRQININNYFKNNNKLKKN